MAQTSTSLPTTRQTVILADDDDDYRDELAEALSNEAFHVLPAADGLQALALAQLQPGCPLLLTDMDMPGLDGIALASRVVPLGIPVVMLLGRISETLVTSARAAGIHQVLPKSRTSVDVIIETLLAAHCARACPPVSP